METTLAILMVLGVFVGIPAVIGFAIAGMYLLADRRLRGTERIKALVEAQFKQPAEAVVEETTKEPAPAA